MDADWDIDAFELWRSDLMTIVVESSVTDLAAEDVGVASVLQGLVDAAYRAFAHKQGSGFLVTGGEGARAVVSTFVSHWAGMASLAEGQIVWLRVAKGDRGEDVPIAVASWLNRPWGWHRDKWRGLKRTLDDADAKLLLVEGVERFASLGDLPLWLKAASMDGLMVVATREEDVPEHDNLRLWMTDVDLTGLVIPTTT